MAYLGKTRQFLLHLDAPEIHFSRARNLRRNMTEAEKVFPSQRKYCGGICRTGKPEVTNSGDNIRWDHTLLIFTVMKSDWLLKLMVKFISILKLWERIRIALQFWRDTELQ
jgi:hypothetical protein